MTGLIDRGRGSIATRMGAELPPGAIATFGLRVTHVGVEFLYLLLLAQLLGAAAFGVYAIAMASATVLGVPAAAGFDRLLIREVAALRAAERWGALRGVLRRATQFALSSSAILALVLSVVAWNVANEALRSALWLAAVMLPLVAFARLRQAAVQGLGHVPAALFPETVVQPVSMLLLALFAFTIANVERAGVNAMAAQLAAATFAMFVGIGLLRRLWPAAARNAEPAYETARWIGSAASMMWMLGMNMVLTSADTIMLGWLLDEATAGKYRVASQIAMLVIFPMTAINLAAAPMLAKLYALGDLKKLRQTASRASRWSVLAAAPVALVLMLAGRPLLGLFGSEFVDARQALVVLVLGYLVNSIAGTAGYLLIMTKHERVAAWIFSVAALVNVVANFLLIPRYGATGAAAATAASMVLVGIGAWLFSRRHFPRPLRGELA